MVEIVNEGGYITDKATRNAYDRIVTGGDPLTRHIRAEAFLRLAIRIAKTDPETFRALIPEEK